MPASISRRFWSAVTSLSRKLDMPPPTNIQLVEPVESAGSAEAAWETNKELHTTPTVSPAAATRPAAIREGTRHCPEREPRRDERELDGCCRVKAGLG